MKAICLGNETLYFAVRRGNSSRRACQGLLIIIHFQLIGVMFVNQTVLITFWLVKVIVLANSSVVIVLNLRDELILADRKQLIILSFQLIRRTPRLNTNTVIILKLGRVLRMIG
jgi:hypothetical protein